MGIDYDVMYSWIEGVKPLVIVKGDDRNFSPAATPFVSESGYDSLNSAGVETVANED
jgi:hypothetical protein